MRNWLEMVSEWSEFSFLFIGSLDEKDSENQKSSKVVENYPIALWRVMGHICPIGHGTYMSHSSCKDISICTIRKIFWNGLKLILPLLIYSIVIGNEVHLSRNDHWNGTYMSHSSCRPPNFMGPQKPNGTYMSHSWIEKIYRCEFDDFWLFRLLWS